MPAGTKVHKCKTKLMRGGKSKGSAIAICQKSTGQSYATGKKLIKKKTAKKKAPRARARRK